MTLQPTPTYADLQSAGHTTLRAPLLLLLWLRLFVTTLSTQRLATGNYPVFFVIKSINLTLNSGSKPVYKD